MYAVVTTGGKQYRVKEGDVIEVERIDGEAGAAVELMAIFKSDGEKVVTEKSPVKAEIVGQTKGKKIVVYKYKAKKNERKKQGHRQRYTKIKILSV